MSDLYLTGGETKGFPEKGDSDYLTPQETAFVQRILRRAEVFPQEFWKAIMQKVALDGEPIPQSQVQGLRQFNPEVADPVPNPESITATVFGDLTTGGPLLRGLSDGIYEISFGALIITGANQFGVMAPQINSTLASDGDSIIVGSSTATTNISSSRSILKELDNSNNNDIAMKYRSVNGGSVTFQYRWMIVTKIGN